MFCSIVIPTYNRRPILEKCLTALESQVLPQGALIEDYEVILVDDGSTDDTI
ncbi:MAG: glycosyltransferase, partial [Cyanobacteria bacterium P01_D01_bin.73]